MYLTLILILITDGLKCPEIGCMNNALTLALSPLFQVNKQ